MNTKGKLVTLTRYIVTRLNKKYVWHINEIFKLGLAQKGVLIPTYYPNQIMIYKLWTKTKAYQVNLITNTFTISSAKCLIMLWKYPSVILKFQWLKTNKIIPCFIKNY